MVFDITQLKKIRKQLELTQSEFAKRANISQSMVAKIESGNLDPTYSYVKKIESALELLTKQEEKQAEDIMHKGVLSVKKTELVRNVLSIFSKHRISQVPVVEREQVVGLVSESSVLDGVKDGVERLTAGDVMSDAPPIIAKNTRLSVIIQLLKFYSLVVVQEKGRVKGVITKADILSHL